MADVAEPNSDFIAQFSQSFGWSSSEQSHQHDTGNRSITTSRKRRRATANRTIQINFRAEPSTKSTLQKLADQLDCSMADVMDRAIRELATRVEA